MNKKLFFDRYDRFLETSQTGTRVPSGKRSPRLHNRYKAIIEENRALFDGASVLDLASHDGRWSMAALDAGARCVYGIEGRPRLMVKASETFRIYNVPRESYDFQCSDIFDGLEAFRIRRLGEYDIIMCLGLLYHTAQNYRLFDAMHRLRPRHIILDTTVVNVTKTFIRFREECIGSDGRAIDTVKGKEGTAIVGIPSRGLIECFARYFDFNLREIDWLKLGIDNFVGCEDYHAGDRRTYVLSAKE